VSRPTSRITKAFVAVGAAALALTVTAPLAANADPSTTGRANQISGSDTIQDVLNGITNGYSANGVARAATQTDLGSWNAFGAPDPITPKAGGQAVGRPHGSGDGVKALSASWNPANDIFVQTVSGVTTSYDLKNVGTGTDNDGVREFDYARSSSKPGTTVIPGTANDKLTYVPFARDAVAPVLQKGAGTTYNSVTNLTTDQLNAIFGDGTSDDGKITLVSNKPVYNTAPGTSTNAQLPLNPVLPQASSGTRSFFLSAIGVGTVGTWVTGATTGGVAENDASALNTAGNIAPFSAGQWISQKKGTVASTFTGSNSATLSLLQANGVLATTGTTDATLAPNAAYYGSATAEPTAATFRFARDTYIVYPTQNAATADSYARGLGQKVVGVNSTSVVTEFGFLRLNYTGTTGRYASNWTN
jgi:hypothetical protein